jgi:hypothetical protein
MVRLYQGPDHLLQVTSTGFSEQYRRFYYRDIQAFLIRQTETWLARAALWGGLALLFALLALAVGGIEAVPLWVITGTWLGALLLDLMLGPSCVCHLRTAVHIETLASLRRTRTARRLLARIKPVIEAAQEGRTTSVTTAAAQAGRQSPETETPTPPVIQQPVAVSPAPPPAST